MIDLAKTNQPLSRRPCCPHRAPRHVRRIASILFGAAALLAVTTPTHGGQIEELMSFQARLTDSLGNPLSDGVHTLDFYIYDAAVDGQIIGVILNVAVETSGGSGIVSTAIGPMDKGWFDEAPRFLGLTIDDVDDDPVGDELSPRIRLTAVPFAFRAFNLQPGAIVNAQSGAFTADLSVGGALGIGTTEPSEQLHLRSATNNAVLLETTGVDTTPAVVLRNDAREWQMRVNGSDHDNFEIRDATTGASRLSIDKDGYVGIGIAAGGAQLLVADWNLVPMIVSSRTAPWTGAEREVGYFGGWAAKSNGDLDDSTAIITHQLGDDIADLGFWTSAAGQGRSRRMTITSGGNIGVGVEAPSEQLHLRSPTNNAVKLETTGADTTPAYILRNDAREWQMRVSGLESDQFELRDATANEARLVVDSSGRVGIGHPYPYMRLHVRRNTSAASSNSMFWDWSHGGGMLLQNTSTGTNAVTGLAFAGGASDHARGGIGLVQEVADVQGALAFYTGGAGRGNTVPERMRISAAGNVGIGTLAPSTRLNLSHASGTANGNTSFWDLSYGGGLYIENNVSAPNAVTGIGFGGGSNNFSLAGVGMIQEVPNSLGALAFFTGGAGAGNSVPERFRITGSGNVGIGTQLPISRLQVNGDLRFEGGLRSIVTNDEGDGADNEYLNFAGGGLASFNRGSYIRVHGNEVVGDGGHINYQLGKVAGAQHRFFTHDGAVNSLSMVIDTIGRVGIGTSTPQETLDVVGKTRTKCLSITGGCDLAERFDVSEASSAEESVVPGMVLVIDRAQPGLLQLARAPYDRAVAGIVSGAGGINTGLTLTQEHVGDGEHAVALAGRVYCWCDATHEGGAGPIEPGDRLTTSSTPGHAMKAVDPSRTPGAVVGKAMSRLDGGRGLVLVLIQPQ